MDTAHAGTSEIAIFGRVLEPEQASLDASAARAILDFDFRQVDKDRMRQLLVKAKEGTLTADEQVEIDNYERVGHLLSLMKSKARRSLAEETLADRTRFGLDADRWKAFIEAAGRAAPGASPPGTAVS